MVIGAVVDKQTMVVTVEVLVVVGEVVVVGEGMVVGSRVVVVARGGVVVLILGVVIGAGQQVADNCKNKTNMSPLQHTHAFWHNARSLNFFLTNRTERFVKSYHRIAL